MDMTSLWSMPDWEALAKAYGLALNSAQMQALRASMEALQKAFEEAKKDLGLFDE